MLEMGGKCIVSIIIDRYLEIINATKKVFLNAYHRLCAWHLVDNATNNIKNPKFIFKFRQCMLGYFEVKMFKRKWEAIVIEF